MSLFERLQSGLAEAIDNVRSATMMLPVTCPNCKYEIPLLPIPGSTGWCKCGLNFALDLEHGKIRWTHDPEYPQSGTEDYELELGEEEAS